MAPLTYLIYTLSGIGGITCLIFHKRLPPVFLWLGVFLLFALISQAGAHFVALNTGNNINYYNLVIVINYLLMYAVFIKMSRHSFYQKRITVVFALGAMGILLVIFPSFNNIFASRALTISNIVITISALLYFYQMLRVPDELSIYKQGKFWIAAGFFIYHLTTFSFWLTYEYIPLLTSTIPTVKMNYSLTVLQYLILLIAVVVQLKYNTDDRTEQ